MAARRKTKTRKTAKRGTRRTTAKRKTKRTTRRGSSKVADLIISKSRTKAAARKCNVSSDFYAALDGYVRDAIKAAEERASANGRKTLRPQDL